MKESESESHSVTFDSLQPHGMSPARILCLWNSPGKNAGVGSHSLLQAIFPAQGLKPGLLHCRQEREREREREWLRFRRVVHMCSKTIFNHPNQLAATACTVLFQYWLTVTQAPGWKYASLIGLYLNQELRFVLCFWHHGKWLAVRAVDDFLLESLPDT